MVLSLSKLERPLNLGRFLRGRFYDGENFKEPTLTTAIIEDGKIVGFQDDAKFGVNRIPEETIIIPGRINLHGHGRDAYDILPGQEGDQTYKEDSWTFGLALAQGGATHGQGMCNFGREINTQEAYRRQNEWMNSQLAHRKKPIVPQTIYALIKPGSRPEIPDAMFKLLWNTFGPTNFPNDGEVPRTLRNYGLEEKNKHFSKLGFNYDPEKKLWVTAHLETIAGTSNDPNLPHHIRRPIKAATDALRIFLDSAVEYGFHPHVAHISSAEEIDIAEEYKAKGLDVTYEITPQTVTLDHETFEKVTGLPIIFGQQNPPIRSYNQKMEARKRLKLIDIFVDDHAPHKLFEKEKGMSGMPQASTTGQAFLEFVTSGDITLADYVQKGSIRPGMILEQELGLRKGQFKKWYEASFTLVTLGKPSRIRNEDVLSKCGWTPYNNFTWSNTIEGVVVAGTLYTQAALQVLRK